MLGVRAHAETSQWLALSMSTLKCFEHVFFISIMLLYLYVGWSEDNCVESVLSSHPVHPINPTQGVRLGSKHLCSLSQLAGPNVTALREGHTESQVNTLDSSVLPTPSLV